MDKKNLRTDNLIDDVEDVDEAFICCVCLDLLYKPIVLACGHISCFWCVHWAMSGMGESHCPICRCPYSHFPSICQLLHFLLLKMYPVAYKRREKQMLEEEKRRGFFSPQLGDNVLTAHSCEESNCLDSPETFSGMCFQTAPYGSTCSNGKINTSSAVEKQTTDILAHANASLLSAEAHSGSEVTNTLAVEESSILENDLKDGICKLFSISDVLCVACKQLLFRPAVLNCGHVYCQSCIVIPVNEALRCQLCQSSHPKGIPKVCLELDHLLEKRFPKEYALRREAVQLQPIHGQQGAELDGQKCPHSSPPLTWSCLSWLGDRGLNVHLGVGCDYCGMFPIVGERYKCKDCEEAIGFDLCGECYNTSSKLPGRFNQQHTPEHKFEPVKSDLIRNIMRRLVSEHSEDSSALVLSDDASEDLEDGLPSHAPSDDTPEDQEGDSHSTVPS